MERIGSSVVLLFTRPFLARWPYAAYNSRYNSAMYSHVRQRVGDCPVGGITSHVRPTFRNRLQSTSQLTRPQTDLHTCGSTFSIAQLCTFTNPGPNSNATKINVVRSFNNCLDHLSRYVDFSAVARKCSKLLQESVKRQTTKNLQQNRPHPPLPSTGSATPTAAVQTNRDERREADIRTSIAPLAFNTTIPGTSQPVISEADFSFITPNSLPFGIEASDYCFNPEAFGPANDGYCPNLDLSDSMPWPALPSLSQLESAAFEI